MRSFIYTVLAVYLASLKALAISADDLARFLDVSSWTVTVELPSRSFTVTVYEIKDGKIGPSVLKPAIIAPKQPEIPITIIAGPEGDHYRFCINYDSSSLSAATSVKLMDFKRTFSLPKTIKAGDYILFGNDLQVRNLANDHDPYGYSSGFLLRIIQPL